MKNRHSIRLQSWNYSSNGYYFVTVCSQNREYLFGEIVDGEMIKNENGRIVDKIWKTLLDHHDIGLDEYQIMPNHFHGIVIIVGATRGSPINQKGASRRAPTTLGTIIGLFKSECTKQIRKMQNDKYFQVWQRNYYEHIIRNENELDRIQKYILMNPEMWNRDRNNKINLDL